MITAEEIKAYAKTLSIPVTGICGAERDGLFAARLKNRREHFSAACFQEEDVEKCVNPKRLFPEAESVIVCLFPYYISSLAKGNISRYASIQDYHKVVRFLLTQLAEYIKERNPEAGCLIACDTSPLMDRMLAYRAGLGFFGENNLLIHPVYGSYFFIGSLLTTLPLAPDAPLERSCERCGACRRACPGQAIYEDFGFACERCVSYLTQIKSLSKTQEQIMKGQDSVYGCDVCQEVCPHNRDVPDTPIRAFYEAPLAGLSQSELASLSGRSFKKQYGNYPFSWCSRDTILKNFRK